MLFEPLNLNWFLLARPFHTKSVFNCEELKRKSEFVRGKFRAVSIFLLLIKNSNSINLLFFAVLTLKLFLNSGVNLPLNSSVLSQCNPCVSISQSIQPKSVPTFFQLFHAYVCKFYLD